MSTGSPNPLPNCFGIIFGNLVQELPNRNCFGINSVIFLCVMVLSRLCLCWYTVFRFFATARLTNAVLCPCGRVSFLVTCQT